MATRIITGVLDYPNGDPWVGARVRFSMVSGSYTVSPAVTYPQTSAVAITDTTGAFSTTLTSGLGIWWDCVLPDGDGFRFALNDGSAVTLEQLRAVATGDPEPISYSTSDIVITAPASGQILRHNGVNFVNVGWPTINVRDAPYGAVGDGVTDDTNAIQSAITAAGSGGVVTIPAGNYKITTTLVIGDGDASTYSTVNSVALLGEGMSFENQSVQLGTTGPGSVLEWHGAASGTLLQINGPIAGIRLENLQFNGYFGGTQPHSFVVAHHVQHSAFRRLQAQGFTGSAYRIDAYTHHPETTDGANHNVWEQINTGGITNGANAVGLEVGGTSLGSSPFLDVALNVFINCVFRVGVAATNTGILLNFCDANDFINVSSSAGATGGGLRRSTVSGTDDFPGNNHFNHCEFYPNIVTENAAWAGEDQFLWYMTGDGNDAPQEVTDRGFSYQGHFYGTWQNLPGIRDDLGTPTAVLGRARIFYDSADDVTKVIHGDGTVGALEGLRYLVGQGGTITQLTSKATGVTLNKLCGQITTHGAALGADTAVSFTWTNSHFVLGTDAVVCNHVAGGTLGAYVINVAPGIGSATVTLRNVTAGPLSEVLVLNVVVVHAVNS